MRMAYCKGEDGFIRAKDRVEVLVAEHGMSQEEAWRCVMCIWPQHFRERELRWNPHAFCECKRGIVKAEDRVKWWLKHAGGYMFEHDARQQVMSEFPSTFHVEEEDLEWNADVVCTCPSGAQPAWFREKYVR
eukprot:1854930-Rhodomonas_salina.1